MSFLLEIVLLGHQPEGNRKNKIRHFSKSQIINTKKQRTNYQEIFLVCVAGFWFIVFFSFWCMFYLNIHYCRTIVYRYFYFDLSSLINAIALLYRIAFKRFMLPSLI